MHDQEMMDPFMNYMQIPHNGGQSSHQQNNNQVILHSKADTQIARETYAADHEKNLLPPYLSLH